MINNSHSPVSRQPSANLNPMVAKGGSPLRSKITSAVPKAFKDGNGRCVSTGLKRTANGMAKETICCVDGKSGKKHCRDRVYPYAAK